MGRRGSGSTRYSAGLADRAAGNVVSYKGNATSIGQYIPVFLPGKPPSLTEAWQATVHRVAELDTTEEALRAQMQDFFRLWPLCPLRVEREGGSAAWLAGTLATPSVQGHRLPPPQALSASFLEPLVAGDQKAFSDSFSVATPSRHLEAPLPGSFSLERRISHWKGHLGVALLCSSRCQCLMGQPLYCSAAAAGIWRERR